MARRLTYWVVEEMVRHLSGDRADCLVLHPSMVPQNGEPRVVRDGKRWLLHRYLYYRVEGHDSDLLFVKACDTLGCLNPYHRLQVKRGSARTHRLCPNGHEYRKADVRPDGSRGCLRCERARRERSNARRRKGRFPRGRCPKGHRLSGDNVYRTRRADGTYRRRCRTCAIDTQKNYRNKRSAK